MKPLALVKIILNLGCVYSIFPIMPSLAGSVPVGASSGVTLPNSAGTPVISRPPTVTIPPVTTPSTPPTVTIPPVTTPSTPPTVTVPSVTTPSNPPTVTTVPSTSTSASEATSTSVGRSPANNSPAIVVTPTTQGRLNQTAIQTFTELRATGSTMANIVAAPTSSNLTTPVRGITITPSNIAVSPSLTNAPSVATTGSNLDKTPMQTGITTEMLVASGNGVDITSNSLTVNIPPVTLASNSKEVSTTVTITTADNQNLNLDLVLSGTSEQVSNGAAFVAMAASADFSLDQIKTGTSIALTGSEFSQVGTLMNSIAGLFDSVAQSGETNLPNTVTVSPQQLNTAIFAFNQIIDNSDDQTIVMLSRNQDFLTIGKVLKTLRGAIDGIETQ